MGGSEGVTRAARTNFMIRIWSSPLALANYVVLGWLVGRARANSALLLQIAINLINMVATILLVLVYDTGIAGAAIAALLAEAVGFVVGAAVCRRYAEGGFSVPRATLFDRAKLMRMLSVNGDIMIRTAALIGVFLFFTAKGARAGDVTLAANSVLNNFLLVSAFFLDGLANAAQQLCGRTFGARDARGFADSTGLAVGARLRAGRCGAARLVRSGLDRLHDGERGRPPQRARLPSVHRARARARRVRLRLRRHLCRRDLGARNAQPDAAVAPDLPGHVVGAAIVRQYRAVDRADRLLRRTRRVARRALSGAVQGDVSEAVATMERSEIRGFVPADISRIALRSIRATRLPKMPDLSCPGRGAA
jgi:hypothetical protein